jgi:ABC-type multidrug transport system ATPase subunit
MIKIKNLSLVKKIPELSQLNLQIDNGEVFVLLSSGDSAIRQLINIFSGLERDFRGTVEVDNVNILSDWNKANQQLVYLDSAGMWPRDMKVGQIMSFFKKTLNISEDKFEELYIKLNMEESYPKRIGEIEAVEWRRILFSMARLRGSKNYIVWDFVKGMPLDYNLEFKKSIYRLKKDGGTVLYLSDDVFFAPEIGDRIGFMKKGKLLLELKAAKMKNLSLKELYFQFLSER